MPTAGGFLAGLTLWFGNRLFASVRQKTTTDYMEAIVVGSGIISVRASIVKSVSALFSISTGTSIGREGPLVQLSSLAASLVGRILKMPIPQRRHLVACGAAAGIACAYKAPIAASLFVAEIILGTVVVESLGPLILASVVAAFVSQFLSGSEPLYKSPGFNLHTRWEIIPLCFVGIFLGFLAPGYLRFLRLAERLFSKVDIPVPFKLALGGAIVGALAILNPEVCGNGQGLLRIFVSSELVLERNHGHHSAEVGGHCDGLRIGGSRRGFHSDLVHWSGNRSLVRPNGSSSCTGVSAQTPRCTASSAWDLFWRQRPARR